MSKIEEALRLAKEQRIDDFRGRTYRDVEVVSPPKNGKVERVLTPPVLYVTRTCTRDTELAGEAIRAGERLVLGIASANRDETVYEEPDRF